MKNEKREITLNEEDSLKDMLQTEKYLLENYVGSLAFVEKKQCREEILKHLAFVAEDVFLLTDILFSKNGNNG